MTIDTVEQLDEMRADIILDQMDEGEQYRPLARTIARAIRAADDAAGLMTVPKETTSAMNGAFHDAISMWLNEHGTDEDVYLAMLAASPFSKG